MASKPEEFYWGLHAVFVTRPEQRSQFEMAFRTFWEDGSTAAALVTPSTDRRGPEESGANEDPTALIGPRSRSSVAPEEADKELDAAMTASSHERLGTKDFEKMSECEIALAKAAIARMDLSEVVVPTRRFVVHPYAERIDPRASLRASLRAGANLLPLIRRRRRLRPTALVVISDISGSMNRYSRMLLHFVHALSRRRERVHSLVFATRLTNITRQIREKNVDVALVRVTDAVKDWSGGTRIGGCLGAFNRDWSRRLLAQGAIVLLITDGLDRDAGVGLAREMERLQKSCRQLIWLNPLLRYARFEPKSLGMRAMIPFVDELRSVHNLASLRQLSGVLSGERVGSAKRWRT